MRWPSPVRPRAMTAARAEVQTSSEVITSITGTVTRTGSSPGSAVHGEQSGVALGQEVDAGAAGVGAVGAEGGDADPDDVGRVRAHRIVVDAEVREGGLADVGDEDVRRGDEAREDVPRARLAQVDGDAALVAVQAQEGGALVAAAGAEVAAVVADERLDLDDVGAEVPEQGRGVGAREHGGEVEDADAGERPCAKGRVSGGLIRIGAPSGDDALRP